MKIVKLIDNQEYLTEYVSLCVREWGMYLNEEAFNLKVHKKIEKIKSGNDKQLIDALLLLDKEILIGFISLFKTDGEERTDLTPWYATMYVKKEYRGKGYSKMLNEAILKYAKLLGYDKIYLKSNLENYYEKFGAKYIETLNNGEKLFYIIL